MAVTPEEYRDLLDGSAVVSLVTLMPDGQPQATPVWARYDVDGRQARPGDADHLQDQTCQGQCPGLTTTWRADNLFCLPPPGDWTREREVLLPPICA